MVPPTPARRVRRETPRVANILFLDTLTTPTVSRASARLSGPKKLPGDQGNLAVNRERGTPAPAATMKLSPPLVLGRAFGKATPTPSICAVARRVSASRRKSYPPISIDIACVYACFATLPLIFPMFPRGRAVFHARVFLTSFVKDEAAPRAKTLSPDYTAGPQRSPNTLSPPRVTPGRLVTCGFCACSEARLSGGAMSRWGAKGEVAGAIWQALAPIRYTSGTLAVWLAVRVRQAPGLR
jgi:hypothetical protein